MLFNLQPFHGCEICCFVFWMMIDDWMRFNFKKNVLYTLQTSAGPTLPSLFFFRETLSQVAWCGPSFAAQSQGGLRSQSGTFCPWGHISTSFIMSVQICMLIDDPFDFLLGNLPLKHLPLQMLSYRLAKKSFTKLSHPLSIENLTHKLKDRKKSYNKSLLILFATGS